MSLNDIKENLNRDIRQPVLRVCETLVDRLAQMQPNQLQRLTFQLLASFAETKPDDDVLQAALTALTTINHNPLTLYFVFYDEGEDREVSISASEVMQSVDDAIFVHPRTGEQIPQFENYLKPVYRASNEFVDAIVLANG